VEVFTRGTGGSGLLRQASFKALRPDKPVSALLDAGGDRIDGQAEDASMATKTSARKTKDSKATATKTRKRSADKATAKKRSPPELSSPGKVLFPEDRKSVQEEK